MPSVVLDLDVLLEAYTLVIKFRSMQATNEASIFQCVFLLSLFLSQVSECVYYDAKNEIENDDDDQEEEKEVINCSCEE